MRRVIFKYFQSTKNGVFFSHIHNRVHSYIHGGVHHKYKRKKRYFFYYESIRIFLARKSHGLVPGGQDFTRELMNSINGNTHYKILFFFYDNITPPHWSVSTFRKNLMGLSWSSSSISEYTTWFSRSHKLSTNYMTDSSPNLWIS